MVMGRPTKYKPEFIDMVDDYLKTCIDKKVRRTKSIAEKSRSWQLGVKVNLPTLEGFASFLGVNQSSVFLWIEKYPNFSEATKRITMEQKKRLIDNGLSDVYNPLITKLVLAANHGMAEKKEVDLTSDGKELKNLTVEFLKPSDDE